MHWVVFYLTKFAQIRTCDAGAVVDENSSCDLALPKTLADGDSARNILQIVFASLAALAVLMVVLAGFKYVRSQGDSKKTAEAKNAIIYAAIGLAIALSAELLVTFLLSNL